MERDIVLIITLAIMSFLYLLFVKDGRPILHSLVIFVAMIILIGFLFQMAYLYIPGANILLVDSDGKFNAVAVNVTIAGLSLFVGMQERYRLKKIDVNYEEYKRVYEAAFDYVSEWEKVIEEYRNLVFFLVLEMLAKHSEEKQIENVKDQVVEEASDPSVDNLEFVLKQAEKYGERVETIRRDKEQTLKTQTGYANRDQAIEAYLGYLKSKDGTKIIRKYNKFRLLLDFQKEALKVKDSEVINGIEKSEEFIEKMRKDHRTNITSYVLGEWSDRKFAKWSHESRIELETEKENLRRCVNDLLNKYRDKLV